MSLSANELLEMKNKITRMKSQRDQATGVVEAAKKRLKDEFGVKSLGEAKKKLADLQTEREAKQVEEDSLVQEFKTKYAI